MLQRRLNPKPPPRTITPEAHEFFVLEGSASPTTEQDWGEFLVRFRQSVKSAGFNLEQAKGIALINHLHALPRKVFDYRPITFLADESRENLLQQALPRGPACPDWLSVCPLYDAEVRVFHFDRQDPFVGMCLNVCTRKRITRSCHGLLADGFPVEGYYVGRLLPSTDHRIQPRFRLAGRVERVEGGLLRLADHRPEEETIDAVDACIEAAAFEPLVRHAFGAAAGAALDRLDSLLTFLSHQIPVQEFEIETTDIPDSRLQDVLNNMGLAT